MGVGVRSLAAHWDDSAGYARRPADWSRERAKIALWSKQREILQSLVDNRYTAVHSCHDSGKTFGAADAVCWWTDAHPTGSATVVTTAPTYKQVSVGWRDVAKIHSLASLKGKINRGGPNWVIGDREVGYGRKPAEGADSTFQGTHDAYVLVVIDEAGGVSKKLFEDVDTLVTNRKGRVLAIGNPDNPTSHFARVCAPGSDWHVIHIDGLRTPNMNERELRNYPLTRALMEAEGIPYSKEPVNATLRDALLDPNWVEERLRRWCGLTRTTHIDLAGAALGDYVAKKAAASPLFTSKVRGVFPTTAQENKVIPLGWVQLAMNRWQALEEDGRLMDGIKGRLMLGVDVARGGEDETCISERIAHVQLKLTTYGQYDTMQTANNVAGRLNHPQALAIVDVNGIGAGVVDRLRELHFQGEIAGEVMPFNASAQDGRLDMLGEFRFQNNRSAAWWRMRELLDPARNSQIALIPDDGLLEELVEPEYKVLNGGPKGAIIAVESKDDIRRRLQRSTDKADATIQSWWVDGIAVNQDGPPPNPNGAAMRWQDEEAASVHRYVGYSSFGEGDLLTAEAVNSRWDV